MRSFKLLGKLFGVSLMLAAFAAFPAYADSIKPQVDPARPHPGPVYPAAAQAAGEEGTVVLQLHISPSGKVIRSKVKQSSGFADLDSAAVKTALSWHYLPAANNGTTRTDDMDLAIQFKLPPAPASQGIIPPH